MADRMVKVMEEDDTIPMFAVGAAHFFYGENSLELLLQKQNYTLERVHGAYDPEFLPDAMCDGSFVEVSNGGATLCKSVWSLCLAVGIAAGLGSFLW